MTSCDESGYDHVGGKSASRPFLLSTVSFSQETNFLWRNQQMHLWLYTLFIDHTYMFPSPSATILRVYSIKECNKKLCVVNLSTIWIYKVLQNSKILDVSMIKWLKVCIFRS
jgi:hypothetical protein